MIEKTVEMLGKKIKENPNLTSEEFLNNAIDKASKENVENSKSEWKV